jgi:acyl-coenzyme A thioesterase PaaI-like protein
MPSLFQRGHAAADFLESWSWPVLVRTPGRLVVRAHLPDAARNGRGQLFGGFTGTYVDLVAMATVHGSLPPGEPVWLATTGMRLEYLAPLTGPEFEIDSSLVTTRRRTCVVDTRFLDAEREVAVHAVTVVRILPV